MLLCCDNDSKDEEIAQLKEQTAQLQKQNEALQELIKENQAKMDDLIKSQKDDTEQTKEKPAQNNSYKSTSVDAEKAVRQYITAYHPWWMKTVNKIETVMTKTDGSYDVRITYHYEGCISDLHLYVNVKVLPNSFTINRHWGTWEEYYSEEF